MRLYAGSSEQFIKDTFQNQIADKLRSAFFSYYQDGEFIMEAATDRFKPHLVEQAFESFGYKEAKLERNFLSVSKKDEFKLKLQHGH